MVYAATFFVQVATTMPQKIAASLPPQPGTTTSFRWICYNQFSLMWCHESMNPQNLQCLVISITRHFQSIGHKDALHAGTSGSITYMCPEPLLENVWYIAPVLPQRLAKPARNLHCRAVWRKYCYEPCLWDVWGAVGRIIASWVPTFAYTRSVIIKSSNLAWFQNIQLVACGG